MDFKFDVLLQTQKLLFTTIDNTEWSQSVKKNECLQCWRQATMSEYYPEKRICVIANFCSIVPRRAIGHIKYTTFVFIARHNLPKNYSSNKLFSIISAYNLDFFSTFALDFSLSSFKTVLANVFATVETETSMKTRRVVFGRGNLKVATDGWVKRDFKT